MFGTYTRPVAHFASFVIKTFIICEYKTNSN